MYKQLRFPALATSALVLAACGGGSGGDSSSVTPPPTGTPAPTSEAVVSVGPISNFGSVVVNGVRYNTDNATFVVNGQPGTQGDLSVGHIVAVKGSVNSDGSTGTADRVTYDDTVEGPVTSIDLAAGTLVVLGQTVIVTADTSFEDNFVPESLEGVSVGDIVEVSGMFTADGDISATRIEREDSADEFEVYGFVEGLDAVALTFNINDLVVDYSSALLEDFPGGAPEDGDFVEVKGREIGANGELIATEVDRESPLPGDDDDDDDDRRGDDDDDDLEFELEGIITRFVSASDFDVAGQPVTITDSTVFEYGSENDLDLNVRVEVKGSLNSDDVLVARKIEFEFEPEIEIEARLDAVDSANNRITLLGITVQLTDGTRMEDDDGEERRLTAENLAAGDYVEIRGRLDGDNTTVIATRLERENDEDDEEVSLQGPVSDISQPTLTILGVTIETNNSTEFEDRRDLRISADDFFSGLTIGEIVEAEGIESSDSVIIAEKVEYED